MKKTGYLAIQGFVLNGLMLLTMYVTSQVVDTFRYGQLKQMLFYLCLIFIIGTSVAVFSTKAIERLDSSQKRLSYEFLNFLSPVVIFMILGFVTRIYFSFALASVSFLVAYLCHKKIDRDHDQLFTIKKRIIIHGLAYLTVILSMFLSIIALNYY